MRMDIDEFVWLPEIVDKLTDKHRVTPDEVEQVFFDQPRFRFHERGRVEGQHMYTALGRSDAGRYLIVYFIFKPYRRALIVSAREMDASERKRYERK